MGGRSPLAGPEFRALWVAEAQSVAGDQLARVAISVLVYQRTSSAALTALTYALTFLPDIVAGPLLSGLADRFPRREVMAAAALSQALLVAVMAIPGAPIWLVAVCVALEAAAQAPFKAAQTAHARVLLGNEHLAAGQARLTTLREVGQLAGLAGAAAVVGLLGTTPALIIDAATFVASAALLRFGLRPRPAARTAAVAGDGVLLPDRRRRAVVALSLLAALTVLPHGLIVPLVHELGAPIWTVGLLLAADPLGLVVGAYVFCRSGRPRDSQHALIAPLALVCLGALVFFAARPHPVLAALLLGISGLGAAYQILAKSAYVEMLPDAITGRATGMVRTGLRAGQGLSVLVGGLLAEALGSASLTIALAGVVGTIGCAIAGFVWHQGRAAVPREAVA
ncbi:putative MFS family arabinose efflux permease [Actinokineospora baliensis]|uniref:MFS transporter n=1 Tax=Actinokineospora baliensis TaxID=547056 RepID=UPI00195E1DEC|nr:MFS transporter [Actinokineospora baliensis]MBM7771391.1 putative MFS family arabinose efflux permease [Actinokineospora baliensis]